MLDVLVRTVVEVIGPTALGSWLLMRVDMRRLSQPVCEYPSECRHYAVCTDGDVRCAHVLGTRWRNVVDGPTTAAVCGHTFDQRKNLSVPLSIAVTSIVLAWSLLDFRSLTFAFLVLAAILIVVGLQKSGLSSGPYERDAATTGGTVYLALSVIQVTITLLCGRVLA